jgi:26S proteasome subunit RPN7/Ubiquitin family
MEVEQVDKPPLLVKTLTDRVIKFDYNKNATISQVKQNISDKELIPFESIKLVLNGVVLSNNTTLKDLFSEVEGKMKKSTDTSAEDEGVKKLYWFYYEPTALLVDPISVATEWDAKNRLRIFKGIYCFSQRRFAEAAELLCDSLGTFTETTFIPFVDCVKYAVIAASFTLDRPSLLKKVTI